MAASAGADTLPGVHGEDNRHAVVMGGPDNVGDYPWPWQAIGRVNRGPGGFCSGALIAPDLVLTARHCMSDRTVGELPSESMHFVAGYRFGDYDAHGRAAEVLEPDAPGPVGDFAIIKLTKPLTIRPIPLASPDDMNWHAAAPSHALLASYSRDRPHLLSVDDQCIILGRTEDLLWRHNCDGPTGSSGAPILVGTDKGLEKARIAGITIGFARSGPSPRGIMVPANVIRAFLRDHGIALQP
ncbi:trypsin-like serine protease [Roseospira marina]|uniref:Trypsin-like serine protease n=2 Tax=Roseospira marina TaxID=140057 RepID=A0A5M6IDA0_9PROT|nr:trypsin-like serine protease [Roseospira marina]KAA5605937.1 trypsin-like serine protease [Roseospira marina]